MSALGGRCRSAEPMAQEVQRPLLPVSTGSDANELPAYHTPNSNCYTGSAFAKGRHSMASINFVLN